MKLFLILIVSISCFSLTLNDQWLDQFLECYVTFMGDLQKSPSKSTTMTTMTTTTTTTTTRKPRKGWINHKFADDLRSKRDIPYQFPDELFTYLLRRRNEYTDFLKCSDIVVGMVADFEYEQIDLSEGDSPEFNNTCNATETRSVENFK